MTTYFNSTELKDEVYDDIRHSDYADEISDLYIIYIFSLVYSLITILLALVVISADIFLITVICRFKRLRTRTNMYILNCCVLNILLIIGIPMFSYLSHPFSSCLRLGTVNVFLILYIVYAFSLALDWFLSGYIPNAMQKYNKFYKYVFAGVYSVFFIEGSIALFMCYEYHIHIRNLIFNVLYIISLIVIIILNILAKKVNLRNSSFKTAYSLTVANIILFSFLPFMILNILSHAFIHEANIGMYIMMFVVFISVQFALVHPILVVYMLGKLNKHFKMAYKRSFKRSFNKYADENLDASDDENDVGRRDVKVNYVFECEQEPKLTVDA